MTNQNPYTMRVDITIAGHLQLIMPTKSVDFNNKEEVDSVLANIITKVPMISAVYIGENPVKPMDAYNQIVEFTSNREIVELAKERKPFVVY